MELKTHEIKIDFSVIDTEAKHKRFSTVATITVHGYRGLEQTGRIVEVITKALSEEQALEVEAEEAL